MKRKLILVLAMSLIQSNDLSAQLPTNGDRTGSTVFVNSDCGLISRTPELTEIKLPNESKISIGVDQLTVESRSPISGEVEFATIKMAEPETVVEDSISIRTQLGILDIENKEADFFVTREQVVLTPDGSWMVIYGAVGSDPSTPLFITYNKQQDQVGCISENVPAFLPAEKIRNITQFGADILALPAMLTKLKEKRADLAARLALAEKENVDLRSEIQGLNEQITALNSQVSDLGNQIVGLQAELDKVKAENDLLRKDNTDLAVQANSYSVVSLNSKRDHIRYLMRRARIFNENRDFYKKFKDSLEGLFRKN